MDAGGSEIGILHPIAGIPLHAARVSKPPQSGTGHSGAARDKVPANLFRGLRGLICGSSCLSAAISQVCAVCAISGDYGTVFEPRVPRAHPRASSPTAPAGLSGRPACRLACRAASRARGYFFCTRLLLLLDRPVLGGRCRIGVVPAASVARTWKLCLPLPTL